MPGCLIVKFFGHVLLGEDPGGQPRICWRTRRGGRDEGSLHLCLDGTTLSPAPIRCWFSEDSLCARKSIGLKSEESR